MNPTRGGCAAGHPLGVDDARQLREEQAALWNGSSGEAWVAAQAVLDLLTLRRHRGTGGFDGLRVLFVGDVGHSRVARSGVQALATMGAEVSLAGPPTLLPESLEATYDRLRAALST